MLKKFGGRTLSAEELCEVKRALKVLDDLEDEGYTALSNGLESKFGCKSALRAILTRHGETPFPSAAQKPSAKFEEEEVEAKEFLDGVIKSKRRCEAAEDEFLQELRAYCEWIGCDDDTAYVFLLRDAFLPYAYYLSKGRDALYPWVMGRAFINKVAGGECVDDELRLPIYEALEKGYEDIASFKAYCKERMLGVLGKYPSLLAAIKGLLGGISKDKICVVESGYCGTIPLMLCALDERVDFRLFTTVPFLCKTYADKIFCKRYEDLRKFETTYSQEYLFEFSSFDGKFFVKPTSDPAVLLRALGEIFAMTE